MRPATDKQKNFASDIAKMLRLELPKEDTIAAYSAFISANIDAYRDATNYWLNDPDGHADWGDVDH